MKKVICAMIFAVIATLGCGCSAGGVYKNADKYTMGNAELQADGIEKLDIEWLSGTVEISYHSENTIVISETSNKSLDEKTTMYYLVDGDTLRVKFAKSGNWDFKNLSKELEVWLPEGMELKELAADTVSADISA
ncbi:MAG: hypothetical protein K2N94_07345, partial [Lachnospiraceae bacterium]|nr:hypothetical protein [Lachnospiraceae bacterium]